MSEDGEITQHQKRSLLSFVVCWIATDLSALQIELSTNWHPIQFNKLNNSYTYHYIRENPPQRLRSCKIIRDIDLKSNSLKTHQQKRKRPENKIQF